MFEGVKSYLCLMWVEIQKERITIYNNKRKNLFCNIYFLSSCFSCLHILYQTILAFFLPVLHYLNATRYNLNQRFDLYALTTANLQTNYRVQQKKIAPILFSCQAVFWLKKVKYVAYPLQKNSITCLNQICILPV